MIELRTQLLVGLLLLLAAAPEASPQTAQSGPPTRQVVVRQDRQIGKQRKFTGYRRNSSGVARALLPTWSWLATYSSRATRCTSHAGHEWFLGLEVSGSTSVANPQSIDARSSSAKQAHSAECAGNSTNKKALGAGVRKVHNPQSPREHPIRRVDEARHCHFTPREFAATMRMAAPASSRWG